MTTFNTTTGGRELAVWDLANITSAGARYGIDPFRVAASGYSDHYVNGATFTFNAAAEPRLVTVLDDDGNLNDGDYSQDTAGGGMIPEYSYTVRAVGTNETFTVYATEVGGRYVNALTATAPIEPGVTYEFVSGADNNPSVSYANLVSTIVPVPDGTVDGSDASEEMGLGYTDDKTDMITTGDDVIHGNEGDDTICADDGDDVIYGGSPDIGGEVTVPLIDANSFMQFFYTDLVIEEFDLTGVVIEGIALADIQINGTPIGAMDLSGVTIGDLILGNGPLAGLVSGEGGFDNITLNGLPIKDALFDLKHKLGDRNVDKDALYAQFEAQIMPALAGIKLNLSKDATPAVVDIYDRDTDGTFDYGQRTQNIENNELFQNATRAAPGASFIVRPDGGTAADDVTIYLTAFDTTVVGFASDKPLVLTQNYSFVGINDLQPSVAYADLVNTYFTGNPNATIEDGEGLDSGNDLLKGEGGNDIIYGQDGNDTIVGGEGADQAWGGNDRDLIIVESAEDGAGDTVVGGAGGDDFDTLDLRGAGPVTIDTVTDSDGNGFDGTVTFANGETLTFTNIEEFLQDEQALTIAPAPGAPTDAAGNLVTAEGDAPVFLEVTRTGPTDEALVVTLVSDDTTEATVPATVTIPAGATSVLVPVSAVDEDDIDGAQLPVITAEADQYEAVSTTVTVADNDVPELTIMPAAGQPTDGAGNLATAEGNATVFLEVKRTGPLDQPLVVTLSSDDETEATVPATVTIPAGVMSVLVPVSAVDEDEVDGTQVPVITADAPNFDAVSTPVSVADNDVPVVRELSIAPAPGAPTDAAGNLATAENGDVVFLEVTRTGPTDEALVVTLGSNDEGEATVPATVTIPAGATSVLVPVTPVDDTMVDGTQLPVITADATDFVGTETPVSIADDDVATPDTICVDGSDDGEMMSVGYADAAGDDITNGDECIEGNGGDDTIRAGGGDDTVNGGDGIDRIAGQSGDDILNGNGERDFINGGGGNDTIDGGDGNDFLNGSTGADVINGGADRDVIRSASAVQANGDVVDGGSEGGNNDFDTLNLRGAGPIRIINQVQDSNGNGTDGTIEFLSADKSTVIGTMDYSEIERILADEIVVAPPVGVDGCVDGEESGELMAIGYNDANDPTNNGGDMITSGDDLIKGNGGDDTIRAAAGDDTVFGGDDEDVISGQSGDDIIYGEAARDVINGGSGDDTIDGGDGNDFLNGSTGADVILGGDDRDIIRSNVAAQAYGDVVNGGAGGNDFDTLDLRGAGDVRFVNQVIDGNGNGFDGTIEFVNAAGDTTGSMSYTEIERFLVDGEVVDGVNPLGTVTYEVADDFENPSSLGNGASDDAYSLKLITAPTSELTGFSTFKAYCLSVNAPLDTDASIEDGVNVLNGELILADRDGAIEVRDQSTGELNGDILTGTGVNGELAVDNMDLINWILNQDWATTDNGDNTGESYTDTEVQFAIWSLTDGAQAEAKTDADIWANALEISALADAEGNDFTGGQFVGVIVEPTNNDQADGGTVNNTQPFIIAVDADFLA